MDWTLFWSTVSWLLNIISLIALVISLCNWRSFGRFADDRAKRVNANLRRRILFISSPLQDTKNELLLLKETELFDIQEKTDIEENDVVIIVCPDYNTETENAWDSSTKSFFDTFDFIKSKDLPVIVYSKGRHIPNETRDKIQSYERSVLCNFPLRLVSDLFAIASTVAPPKPSADKQLISQK